MFVDTHVVECMNSSGALHKKRPSKPGITQLTLQDLNLPRKRQSVNISIKLYQILQDYIYVPTDFDTKRKSPLRANKARKGLIFKDSGLGANFGCLFCHSNLIQIRFKLGLLLTLHLGLKKNN